MLTYEKPNSTQQTAISQLLDISFGGTRVTKNSYRFRDGLPSRSDLARIALDDGKLVGTIQYWPVSIGESGLPGLLLGPVAVCPSRRGEGIGVHLIRSTLSMAAEAGDVFVALVGDAAYYQQFDFQPAQDFSLYMPGEPDRVMARFLGADLPGYEGEIKRPDGASIRPVNVA